MYPGQKVKIKTFNSASFLIEKKINCLSSNIKSQHLESTPFQYYKLVTLIFWWEWRHKVIWHSIKSFTFHPIFVAKRAIVSRFVGYNFVCFRQNWIHTTFMVSLSWDQEGKRVSVFKFFFLFTLRNFYSKLVHSQSDKHTKCKKSQYLRFLSGCQNFTGKCSRTRNFKL